MFKGLNLVRCRARNMFGLSDEISPHKKKGPTYSLWVSSQLHSLPKTRSSKPNHLTKRLHAKHPYKYYTPIDYQEAIPSKLNFVQYGSCLTFSSAFSYISFSPQNPNSYKTVPALLSLLPFHIFTSLPQFTQPDFLCIYFQASFLFLSRCHRTINIRCVL